jgi:hypothetical protein
VATSPTLSSTVSSWTSVFSAGDTINTTTSAAFSPPARSLITVAVAISGYLGPANDPSYSISNTGTALTWTRRAHDRVTSGLGSDGNYTGEVVVYEAWNASSQTDITIAVTHSPSGAFPVFTHARAYVWVDASGAGASHATSGGSVNTTNNLTVSAAAVTNSRVVVAAVEGTLGTAATSSDLTIATTTSPGGLSALVGHKLADSNPETFNLDASGSSAAEWVYASSQVYLKTDPDVGDNGASSGLNLPSTLAVPTPAVALDNSQPITVAAIQSTEAVYAATIGYSQTISPAAIASTAEVKPAPIGAPVSNFACDGTPGTMLAFSPGSFVGGTTGATLFSEWEPEPAAGFMGGNQWEQSTADQFEFRADVDVRRGQSYIRPTLDCDPPQWQVHVPATPETPVYFHRAYFFLEEYPDNDMAFMWYEESYPWVSGQGPVEPINWVGMCPWGRFEVWTNGGNTRTDPNVIPLNKWFRVEVRMDTLAQECRIIARIYFDAEAPVEGYDIEMMSDWSEVGGPAFSGVPYSPISGGVGDTMGAPYGSPTFTNDLMKAYFDDVALGPEAFGWIGPSGGALSHSSTASTATVATPQISQTQPLADVGGIISTATIPAPTVTVPPPLDPITPTAIPTTSTVGAPIVVESGNRTLDVASILSAERIGAPSIARTPGTIYRPRIGVIERPGPL